MESATKITIELKKLPNIEIDKLNEDILNLVKIYLDGIGVDYGCSGEHLTITGKNNEVYLSAPFFHECPF